MSDLESVASAASGHSDHVMEAESHLDPETNEPDEKTSFLRDSRVELQHEMEDDSEEEEIGAEEEEEGPAQGGNIDSISFPGTDPQHERIDIDLIASDDEEEILQEQIEQQLEEDEEEEEEEEGEGEAGEEEQSEAEEAEEEEGNSAEESDQQPSNANLSPTTPAKPTHSPTIHSTPAATYFSPRNDPLESPVITFNANTGLSSTIISPSSAHSTPKTVPIRVATTTIPPVESSTTIPFAGFTSPAANSSVSPTFLTAAVPHNHGGEEAKADSGVETAEFISAAQSDSTGFNFGNFATQPSQIDESLREKLSQPQQTQSIPVSFSSSMASQRSAEILPTTSIAETQAAAAEIASTARLHQFERDFVHLRSENSRLLQKLERCEHSVTDWEGKYSELQRNFERLKQECSSVEQQKYSKAQELHQLHIDNARLIQQTHNQNLEIDRQNAELQRLATELINKSHNLSENQMKLSQSETAQLPLNYKIQKLQQEKELIEKQKNFIETELNNKSQEIIDIKRQKAVMVAELEVSLALSKKEASKAQTDLDKALAVQRDQSASMQRYIDQLSDAENQLKLSAEKAAAELSTQTRLANLYMRARDESNGKLEELIKNNRRMQEEINRELAKHSEIRQNNEETIVKLRKEAERAQETNREQQQTIENLRKEVEEAKEKASAQFSFALLPQEGSTSPAFPSNNVTISMTQSTTTQNRTMQIELSAAELYSRYMHAAEELRKKQRENKEMEIIMIQINKELQEREPLLLQKEQHYNILIQQNEDLKRRCQQLQHENHSFLNEISALGKEKSHLLAQIEQLNLSTDDLARQVRALLQGRTGNQRNFIGNSSAQDIISAELVEFSNIEELQTQNQKLLAVIRDLTQKQEQLSADKDENGSKSTALVPLNSFSTSASPVSVSAQLQEARGIIEELKSDRERVELRLKAVTQSLQLYNSGVGETAEGGTELWQYELQAKQRDWQQKAADFEAEIAEITQKHKDLQQQFNLYKQDRQETELTLQKQLEIARNNSTEKNLAAAKALAEQRYLQDKYSEANSTLSRLSNQIELLNNEKHDYSTQIIALNQSIIELKTENLGAVEKSRHSEMKYNLLHSELTSLRASEQRLSTETELLRSNYAKSEAFNAQMQQIITLVEQKDKATIEKLSQEVEKQRGEIDKLREEAENERKSTREAAKFHSTQLDEAHRKIESAHLAERKAREELILAQSAQKTAETSIERQSRELSELKQQLEALITQKNIEKAKLSATQFSALSREQQLELETKEKTGKIAELTAEITQLQLDRNNFQSIATQYEHSLREINEIQRKYKEQSEQERNSLREQKDSAVRRVEFLSQTCSENEREIEELREKLEEIQRSCTAEVDRKNEELLKVQRESAEILAAEEQRREEISLNSRRAAEAEKRYERELQQHADARKELTLKREELAALQGKFEQLRENYASKQNEFTLLETGNSGEINALKADISQLAQKNNELQKQNDLLYQQIDNVTAQTKKISEDYSLAALLGRNSASSEFAGAAESPSSAEISTLQQQLTDLREINRFLRSEKELLATELERNNQLNARYSSQTELQSKQIAELKGQIAELINKNSGADSPQNSAQHAEVLAQLNQLNLLNESNTTLRDENRKSAEKIKELNKLVSEAQSRLEPMQKAIRLLEADKSTLEFDINLLKQENVKWQQRNAKLLDKYNQVDPEVYKQLQLDYEQSKQEYNKRNQELEALINQQKQELSSFQSKEIESNERGEKLKQAAAYWRNKYNESKAELETKSDEFQHNLNELTQRLNADKLSSAERSSILNQLDEARKTAENQTQRLLKALDAAEKLLQGKENLISQQKQQILKLKQNVEGLQEQISGEEAEKAELIKLRDNAAAAEEKHRKQADSRVNLVKSQLETRIKKLEEEKLAVENEAVELKEEFQGVLAELESCRKALSEKSPQNEALEVTKSSTPITQLSPTPQPQPQLVSPRATPPATANVATPAAAAKELTAPTTTGNKRKATESPAGAEDSSASAANLPAPKIKRPTATDSAAAVSATKPTATTPTAAAAAATTTKLKRTKPNAPTTPTAAAATTISSVESNEPTLATVAATAPPTTFGSNTAFSALSNMEEEENKTLAAAAGPTFGSSAFESSSATGGFGFGSFTNTSSANPFAFGSSSAFGGSAFPAFGSSAFNFTAQAPASNTPTAAAAAAAATATEAAPEAETAEKVVETAETSSVAEEFPAESTDDIAVEEVPEAVPAEEDVQVEIEEPEDSGNNDNNNAMAEEEVAEETAGMEEEEEMIEEDVETNADNQPIEEEEAATGGDVAEQILEDTD
jgi:nucleoprotein TPR